MKKKLKPLYDDDPRNLGELTSEGKKVSKKVYKSMRKLVQSIPKNVSLKHLELMLMRASSSECTWESLERALKAHNKRGKKK